ncbi:MAG: hypothetical protein QOG09_1454 [Solirubrobacterales bacterium]|jgi:RNA polymerase sigma-70 factor (ECF subfamily)|nr:hypothetical protein [Solirubrobacterales bacterium]MDX6652198.1 hypothetical protein [Solirubrobacterales bacterium]MDX6663352.1 hypothetical protein [Solirubrobacterales bacterium]
MNQATIDFGAARAKAAGDSTGDVDTQLAAQAKDGDSSAFGQLYTRNFDSVYAYLRVAVSDAQEAEDATQQVFTKVLESLPAYEDQGRPFQAWLFRIARNQAIDYGRRSGRVEPEEPQLIEQRSKQSTDDLRALQWTSDDELMMLVKRLPDGQRQVIFLRYVLDLTTADIAEVLDRKPEAIRQLQSRALRFLEQRLVALGREPYGSPARRRLSMRAQGRRGALRPAHGFSLAR